MRQQHCSETVVNCSISDFVMSICSEQLFPVQNQGEEEKGKEVMFYTSLSRLSTSNVWLDNTNGRNEKQGVQII